MSRAYLSTATVIRVAERVSIFNQMHLWLVSVCLIPNGLYKNHHYE